MIHHVSVEVFDLERSGRFYDALLAPLGWRRLHSGADAIGYGFLDDPLLVLCAAGLVPRPGTGHFCIAAAGIPAVRAAWEAGVAAGGRGERPPGPRRGYEPGYFSAYLRDPDGYRIEIAARAAARARAA